MTSTSSTPSFNAGPNPQELEHRLPLLTPKDTTRGFLFNAALETVKSELGEAAMKRCLEASDSTSFTAFFSYPVSSLLKLIYAAGNELSGKYGGFDGAVQHLGYRVAPRFLESATGKVLISLVGKEPKRLIESLPTAYRTAWDHGSCSLSWSGPKSGRLVYNNAMPVAYFAGSVMQMLAAAQLKNTRVTGRQTGLTTSEVDFSWD